MGWKRGKAGRMALLGAVMTGAVFCGAFIAGGQARAQETAPVVKMPVAAPAAQNAPLAVLPFKREGSTIVLTLPMTQSGAGDAYRVSSVKRPFRLVLDTGAELSLLAEEAITNRDIALPPVPQGDEGVTVGGVGNTAPTKARRLESAAFRGDKLNIHSSPVVAPLGMTYRFGIEGFLGAELFQTFVVEVNYIQKTVRLFDPENFSAPTKENGFVRIPMHFSKGDYPPHVLVEVSPFGAASVTADMIVDTGLDSTLSFNGPFVKKNQWPSLIPKTVPAMVYGLGGASQERVGRLKQIRLGGETITSPYADFSFATQGALADDRFDGLIGSEILCRFTAIYDYTRNVLYLRPNDKVAEPFPYRYYGLHFNPPSGSSDGWIVASVEGKSPAALVGVKAGDIIFAVDGKAVGEMSRTDRVELLNGGKAGDRIFTIGDAKGEKKRDVRVTPIAL